MQMFTNNGITKYENFTIVMKGGKGHVKDVSSLINHDINDGILTLYYDDSTVEMYNNWNYLNYKYNKLM